MKKFLVLALLFALPLVAYLFFASGVHNFGKLPVLTEKIAPLDDFSDLNGNSVQFQDKITILGFFGSQVPEMHGHAFNLNWVIYKDYHEFYDFQFVILVEKGQEPQVKALKKEMAKTTDLDEWNFAFGSEMAINKVFQSLKTDLKLNVQNATERVFIIDKNMALRGRDDDEEEEKVLFGYDTSSVAELKNKMVDDVKVILAEYRLKLKKYKKRKY
ncbi:MAG TPA: hypothetical protein VFM65_07905 [Flavobacteriaceae bacterium]|nr:hypothetical protein [Flavobacteriaceae bacterium]